MSTIQVFSLLRLFEGTCLFSISVNMVRGDYDISVKRRRRSLPSYVFVQQIYFNRV